MTHRSDCFVSVVTVLHNQENLVADFVGKVHAVLERTYTNFELVLVDNCSSDQTRKNVEGLLSLYKCVRILYLSHKSSLDIAFTAGLDSAIGDFVVTMLPECDPPADIVPMVQLCRDGNPVVAGVAQERRGGAIYGIASRSFHFLMRRFAGLTIPPGVTWFCVLSREVVNAITRVRQRKRVFAFLLLEVGYQPYPYPYHLLPHRKSKARLLSNTLAGVSLIVHYSNRPLRLAAFLGLLGSLLSFAYASYVVVMNLLRNDLVQGWTTLSLVMSGLFCVLFSMQAILGEYIGRILDESSERPLYFVRAEKNSSVMIADATRRNVLEQSVREIRAEDAGKAFKEAG